jgi:hypothetical protein
VVFGQVEPPLSPLSRDQTSKFHSDPKDLSIFFNFRISSFALGEIPSRFDFGSGSLARLFLILERWILVPDRPVGIYYK